LKTKYLCLYYAVAIVTITLGLSSYVNYLSVYSLWENDLCPSSIEAHKHFGVTLLLSDCYSAQHGTQIALITLIFALDAISTLLFVIKLDMNRKVRVNYKMENRSE
jgi:hypothetical protein